MICTIFPSSPSFIVGLSVILPAIILSCEDIYFSKLERKFLSEFVHVLLLRVCRLIKASDLVYRLHLVPEILGKHFLLSHLSRV